MRDKLTLKQERFAWEYVRNGGNASQAYRDVYSCNGSSDETVWKRACELHQDGKVAERIDQLEREHQAVLRLDKNSVLAGLLRAAANAEKWEQAGPQARCWELIGKAVAGGMFTDRTVTAEDQLSREQLIEAISDGSEERRKLAKRLFDVPDTFDEPANASTKDQLKSTG